MRVSSRGGAHALCSRARFVQGLATEGTSKLLVVRPELADPSQPQDDTRLSYDPRLAGRCTKLPFQRCLRLGLLRRTGASRRPEPVRAQARTVLGAGGGLPLTARECWKS